MTPRGRAYRWPLTLRLYRGFSRIAAPAVGAFLRHRLKRGKEDAVRIGERSGHATLPRPAGPLVWLHAASVGETMSMLPLVSRLAAQSRVMLTTGTLTSAQLAASRLPENAFHQFVPMDTHAAVARFLDHWRPDLGIFCESELWPNLMMAAFERDIPLGIVNGRMSARSYRGWSRVRGTVSALLTPLAFCLGQSEADSARFAALGAPARPTGNLKFDVPALPFDGAEVSAFRAAIGGRAVFLAASTHPGEEELVVQAAGLARARHPGLLTIIVPRHPQRGGEIGTMIERLDGPAARRSQGAMPDAQARYYIADTLGELGLFFALADIAFMGGSLVEHGGHNPIEPVKLGVPVISGPHVANFQAIFAMLSEAKATRIVGDAPALGEAVAQLLADAEARAALARNAAAIFAGHEGALARTLETIAPFIAPLLPHAGTRAG